MTELEAVTIIVPTEDEKASNSGAETRQFGRRHPLPLNALVRLGQDPTEVDCAIPEDRAISRFHALLTWNGEVLEVKARPPIPPKYPQVPKNHIKYNGVAVRECVLNPGEFFTIGQTRFTLSVPRDNTTIYLSDDDDAVVRHEQDFTRADLERLPFNNPRVVLKALEKLPDVLRLATNQQALFRQMMKVLLNAVPRAEAGGLVSAVTGDLPGELAVAVQEHSARIAAAKTSTPGKEIEPYEFAPARKLVHKAVDEKKSILDFWVASDEQSGSRSGGVAQTPWAICTPFQDGSRDALYIEGRHPHPDAATDEAAVQELTGYQKVAELIVGLLEVTRQTHRLTSENAMLRQSLPPRLARMLDDPARLKELLEPRETDVTVVFCDLRNYSTYVEKEGGNLTRAWEKVAAALNGISRTITLCDGVVARIQGDAVMAFWGWPDSNDKHLADAARAALQIRDEFSGRMQHSGMKCGLGMAHGRAVVGRLGAHDLAEIDLFGPVVNLAARLETMTKAFGVGVLVDGEVAARLSAADPTGTTCRARPLGKVRPKGMATRFPVFELIPAGTQQARDAVLASWAAAVELFTAGKWAEAADRLDYFPEDPAAACLLRVMDRTKRKPPADWDGSFTPIPKDAEPA